MLIAGTSQHRLFWENIYWWYNAGCPTIAIHVSGSDTYHVFFRYNRADDQRGTYKRENSYRSNDSRVKVDAIEVSTQRCKPGNTRCAICMPGTHNSIQITIKKHSDSSMFYFNIKSNAAFNPCQVDTTWLCNKYISSRKYRVKMVPNVQISQKRRHHAAPCQLLFHPIAMRNTLSFPKYHWPP